MRKFTICLTFIVALSLPLGAHASVLPWTLPSPDGLWGAFQSWLSTPWLVTTKGGAMCDPNGAPAQCPSSEIGAALDPEGAPSDSDDAGGTTGG